MIVALVLGYAVVVHGTRNNWTPIDLQIVRVLTGFLLLAAAIFAAICISPAPNVPRRLIGMIADASGCTWYMCVAEEYGFVVIGIYLFITFGNGFRYGRRYLFGCQALCLIGFVAVLMFVPFWIERSVEGICLLTALIVLPLYVSTLLRRIHEARQKAEEANKAKSSFLANMSHEIRTPLNGIVGVVDLFRTTDLTAQQQELVQLLRHSTTVLRSLVDDVLDISKIESGRLAIEVSSFDLHASINGLLQLLRPHAGSKGLSLHAVVDPELDYRLKGDSHHLRQILLNLLGNAIKFTERGEIVLTVTMTQATETGVTARFEVSDTGIGIPPDLLPKIFERFVQVDQSATRRFGGSGLGTTIAKQLVELMGGTIGVQSQLGEGTTFWFEIPLLRDNDNIDRAAGRGDGGSLREPTILIADSGTVQTLTAVIAGAGERVELVSPNHPFGPRLQALTSSGIRVRAIVASCSVESACAAFTATRQRIGEQPIALIYIATRPLSVVDSARIKSIREAVVLDGTPTSRLVANAIHAAVATGGRESEDTIDLPQLLKQHRASLRVLVADDNPTNQAIISQLLSSAGHSIIVAADGDEALDLYEHEPPDLALLDFNMPGRNGLEVVRAIRVMEPPGVRIPAIILSASVTPEARTRAIDAGADEFVGKPFDAVSLLTIVDKLAARVRPNNVPATRSSAARRAPIARSVDRGAKQWQQHGTILSYERLSEIEDISRDSQFTMELLRGFKGDVVSLLKRLDAAVSGDATEPLGDVLHALKGAAVGIGALQLAYACEDVAESVRNNPEKLANAVRGIHASASTTFEHLDGYVRRQHRVAL
ncbi:MAG: ATP-binding protein [Burkholderiales bacterium]